MLTKTTTNNLKNTKGFTLIELLIVISIIAILSGVLYSLINSTRQKAVAEDAVRRATLEKLAQGIESLYIIENTLPTVSGGAPVHSQLSTYITAWPTPPTSPTYTYNTYAVGSNQEFMIYVQKATDTTRYSVFYSDSGRIRECTNPANQSTCN